MEDIKPEIKQTGVIDLEKEVLSYTAQFLIGAVFITLFLILVCLGWLLSSKNTSKNLSTKIVAVDNQLSTLKDLEKQVQVFSGAVTNIQSAISQKQLWSKVFKEINSLTPKDVVYTNLSADETNKVRIDGSTTSFSSLAKLIVALKGGAFKSVTLNSTSISLNKITFSLNLELSPGFLKEVQTKEQK